LLDGRFVILDNLGRGGTAKVFRAFDTVSREMRAVKLLHPELARQQGFIESFFEEARAMVDLDHENLVKVYGTRQTDDGLLFLVLEYVKGLPLRRFMTPRPTLPLRAMLQIVVQATQGISHAHEAGIVHRDIKAENILVVRVPNRKTTARLVDFGMACIADQSTPELPTMVGTPAVMSPEAIEQKPVGVASDIYSLGLLLFEMVTRRPAFAYEQIDQLLEAHLHEAPSPLAPLAEAVGVPESFLACVVQCLRKEPTERPESLAAVVEQLEHAIEALPDLGDNQAKFGNLPTVLLEGGSDQVTLQDWHLGEQPTLSSIEDICDDCGAPLARGAVCLSCRRALVMPPAPAEMIPPLPADFFDEEPPRLRPSFQALWTASLGVLKVMAREELTKLTLRSELEKVLAATVSRYGCEQVKIIPSEDGFRLILIAVDAVEGDMEDVMQASAQILLNVVGATIKTLHHSWSGAPTAGICGAVAYGTVTPPSDSDVSPDTLIKGSEADLATRLQGLAKPWEVLAPSGLFDAEDLVDTLLVPIREKSEDGSEASCEVSVWRAVQDSSRFLVEKGS